MSSFEKLFNASDRKREDVVMMARTAEAAERYDDMCKYMSYLVNFLESTGTPLTQEERNLLSVAYKNVIGTRRASWRTLNSETETTEDSFKDLVEKYKIQVETELSSTCKEVLDLLNKLIPMDIDAEAKVFYLKMAGDYYRYLAESDVRDETKNKAAEYYSKAYVIAQDKLPETHPIRLGLALNYSVCHYEILKDKKAACSLAKQAFDDAISKLDKLEEADYKDSTLIMQLLRDNLTLWTADAGDDDGEQVQVQDYSDEDNEN